MDKISNFYENNVFILPEGIDISNNKYGVYLLATKKFKKGETVFLFKCVTEYLKNIKKKNHVLKINNKGAIQKYNVEVFLHYSGVINNICMILHLHVLKVPFFVSLPLVLGWGQCPHPKTLVKLLFF